jgi:hypothetical protein
VDGHEAGRKKDFTPQPVQVVRFAVPGGLLQEEHEKREKNQEYAEEPEVAPEGIEPLCENHFTK